MVEREKLAEARPRIYHLTAVQESMSRIALATFILGVDATNMVLISVHREVLLGSLSTVVDMQVAPFSVRPVKDLGVEAGTFSSGRNVYPFSARHDFFK